MVRSLKTALISFVFLFTIVASYTQEGYHVVDKAGDFELNMVAWPAAAVADIPDAKGVFIAFLYNTYPYVELYEGRMIERHSTYSPNGLPVIAINPNDVKRSAGDGFHDMRTGAKFKSFPFAFAHDDTQEITKTHGVTNNSHVFLSEKEGSNYIVKYTGAIDNNYCDASALAQKYAEEAILAVGFVGEERTKSAGCMIEWRKPKSLLC